MTDHITPSPCWLMWDKGFSEDVTFAQFEMAWTSFSSSAKKVRQTPKPTKQNTPNTEACKPLRMDT